MATFGQGINPQLGAINYSPILQGSVAGAQMAAQGGSMIGQGLANLGQEVGKGIATYQLNKKIASDAIGETEGLMQGSPAIVRWLTDPNNDTQAAKLAKKLQKDGTLSVNDATSLHGAVLSFVKTDQQTNQNRMAQQAADADTQRADAAMLTAQREGRAGNVVNPASFNITDPVTGQTSSRTVDQVTGRVIGEAPVRGAPPQFGNLSPGTIAVQDPKTGSWSVQQIQTDPAEVSKKEGKKKFGNLLSGMVGNYLALDQSGGMVNPNNSISQNIAARLTATDIGQALTGAAGQQAQSIRARINNAKPLLIQLIRQSTGMSQKAMDTNAELNFYLQAASDPKLDLFSNLVALDTLDTQYGDGDVLDRMLAGNPELLNSVRGGKISSGTTKPSAALPTWNQDKQDRLNALQAKQN